MKRSTSRVWLVGVSVLWLLAVGLAVGLTWSQVTRGFPLEPRPGERADHPHQVGAWFTYGDVNGIDYWGYSDATPADEVRSKGTIVHKAITRAVSGDDRGELAVTADWVMPDGSTIIEEETLFVFRGGPDSRSVDRVTRWAARDTGVVFNDTKEGAFGIRVARSLEQPSTEPEIFTDDRGRVPNVCALKTDPLISSARAVAAPRTSPGRPRSEDEAETSPCSNGSTA